MGEEINEGKPQKLHLIKDLSIIHDFHHAVSGAHLLLAQHKNPPSEDEKYIVAWRGSWQRTLGQARHFRLKKQADQAFKNMRRSDVPKSPHIMRDYQRALCYSWQDKVLGKHQVTYALEAMQQVLHKISKDFDITKPDLGEYKYRKNCQYFIIAKSINIETF